MDLGIAWETLLLSGVSVCLSMASILPIVGLPDCIRAVDFSYSPLRIAHTTVYLHLCKFFTVEFELGRSSKAWGLHHTHLRNLYNP